MFTDSIYEALIIIGILLIVVDIFIPNDVSSLVAHALFSTAIALAMGFPPLYTTIIAIVCWMILVLCHYVFFKKIITSLCNKFLSKTVIEEEPVTRLIGKKTKVITVDGVNMIRLEGDLMSFENADQFSEGSTVEVTGISKGLVMVSSNNEL